MKNLFATVILWAGLFMPNSFAQYSADMLNILSQEELVLKIVAPQVRKLKHSDDVYHLISAFKNNLASVASEIPTYDIFKINYIKNKSLRIEEVEGIVKYQMENGQLEKAHKQNVVHLRDGNIQVFIYVNDLEELSSTDYKPMIQNALAKVKRKFLGLYPIEGEYYYSYSIDKMVDGYEKVKPINRVGLVIGGTIGFFKSQPIYEFNTGIGYRFGVKNKSMVYLFYGQLHQYNQKLARPEVANLYGIGLKPNKRGSLSIAIVKAKNFESENLVTRFDDVRFRTSATFYPTRGVSVASHFYYGGLSSDESLIVFPTVSFGFGF